MILSAIREALEQKRKAREVFRHLSIPQAVCYLAADQITRPGKRRAARWATKKPLCDQHKGKKQRKRFIHILAYQEGKFNA